MALPTAPSIGTDGHTAPRAAGLCSQCALSPLAPADPVGPCCTFPQVGEQLGGPGNIMPAQHREGMAEASPAPRAQPENLVLACFPTRFGCLICNK